MDLSDSQYSVDSDIKAAQLSILERQSISSQFLFLGHSHIMSYFRIVFNHFVRHS